MEAALVTAVMAIANQSYEWRGWPRGAPRPVYLIGIVLAIAGWLLWGFLGALAAISYLSWRLPGWLESQDMGMLNGTLERDLVVLLYRNLYAFPLFLWFGLHGDARAIYIVPLALGCTLCYFVAWRVIGPDGAPKRADGWAGLVWGLTIAALFMERFHA